MNQGKDFNISSPDVSAALVSVHLIKKIVPKQWRLQVAQKKACECLCATQISTRNWQSIVQHVELTRTSHVTLYMNPHVRYTPRGCDLVRSQLCLKIPLRR